MKTTPLLVIVTLIALAATAVTQLVMSPSGGDRAELQSLRQDMMVLEQRLASMDGTQDRMASSMKNLESLLGARPELSATVSQADVQRAVDAALRERLDELPVMDVSSGEAALAAAGEDAENPMSVDDALALLAAAGDDWDDGEAAWKRIADAGMLDEVIDRLKEMAEADPYDPDLQLALGVAYLQKTQAAGNGPEAGQWAMAADRSFDAALALDETNWDARFTKAVSLSFWPPIFGKQSEAIKQFEILTAQQRNGPTLPQHSQTYLMLGNLYQQSGQADKALATWQAGLELFPGMQDLLTQIENAQ